MAVRGRFSHIRKREIKKRRHSEWQLSQAQGTIAVWLVIVFAISVLTVEVGTHVVGINGSVPLSFVENNLELAYDAEISTALIPSHSLDWQIDVEESELAFRLSPISLNTYRGPPARPSL